MNDNRASPGTPSIGLADKKGTGPVILGVPSPFGPPSHSVPARLQAVQDVTTIQLNQLA
jgi:hypothetical protein